MRCEAQARRRECERRRARYGCYMMAVAAVSMLLAGLVRYVLLGGLALVADCGVPCADKCPLPAGLNHNAVGCICVAFAWVLHDGAFGLILPEVESDAYHGVTAAGEGDEDEGSRSDDEESSGR